jgi:hypothetical protein
MPMDIYTYQQLRQWHSKFWRRVMANFERVIVEQYQAATGSDPWTAQQRDVPEEFKVITDNLLPRNTELNPESRTSELDPDSERSDALSSGAVKTEVAVNGHGSSVRLKSDVKSLQVMSVCL